MAFDAFMKIDGIPGESTDDAHKDWIEILDYSHALEQPASVAVSTAGGGTAERCDHDDFGVKKFIDKASPKIYDACCSGKHIKDVTIELCRAGGDKVKYMEIKMEEVIVSSVRPSGNPKGNDGFPTESVAFNYGKITWTYTQQKRADGSGGGNVTAGWSLIANKAAS
jgi:type VI secretion system secreted protein Hcp